MNAVVLDLFGTLVDAPTPQDRARAATTLARVIDCSPQAIENYFVATWQVRHDGTLPTLSMLAAHLIHTVGGASTLLQPVMAAMTTLAEARLRPDPSVAHLLTTLRATGFRLGVLSDASADIAAAWPNSPLAPLVDTATFSSTARSTKPDQALYARIIDALDAPPSQTLYCGDGGGDELRGALAHGMAAVAVRRRGSATALVFGDSTWTGPVIDAVESLPQYLKVRV